MDHQHHVSKNKFFFSALLNTIISLSELIGGIWSGSLALVSDSVHNFTDTLSLILAWGAQILSGKKENEHNTYGYRRAQILAAFVNAILLLFVSVGLVYEAIQGFLHPSPIKAGIMLIIAIIGLVANVLTALLLVGGNHESLNQRAAFLHILADALSSVGVILAGVLIYFFNWVWLDPLLTVMVAIYMLKEAWPIVKETTQILMEANTKLDVDAICYDLQNNPLIKNCHHFHAWQIDEHNTMLSFHITLPDQLLSETEVITGQVRDVLKTKYGVSHVTIQVEVEKGQNSAIIISDEKYK